MIWFDYPPRSGESLLQVPRAGGKGSISIGDKDNRGKSPRWKAEVQTKRKLRIKLQFLRKKVVAYAQSSQKNGGEKRANRGEEKSMTELSSVGKRTSRTLEWRYK